MDDRRFDQLTRALGGASTRRSALGALGALAGLLAGGAALGAEAGRKRAKDGGPRAAGKRRNRKRCKPECTGNFSCVKGACTCEQVLCGVACCDTGQVCQRGRCVGQGTVFCHDLQEPCGDGTPCCDGLQCGSGYSGGPVTCRPAPGEECEADDECLYGYHCADGACVLDEPPPDPDADPCASVTCADGQVCVAGACACTAESCAAGCCDAAGACQPGTAAPACGAPGGQCAACTGAAPVCAAGACVQCVATVDCAAGSTCVANACVPCLGCIDGGGACVAYADETPQACGAAGAACASCPANQDCNLSGACVTCTIAATGNPAADGEALRAIVESVSQTAPTTITVGGGVYRPTPGGSTALTIARSLTIEACTDRAVTIDGGWTGGTNQVGKRVMSIGMNTPTPLVTVTLSGITIANGFTNASDGACVYLQQNAQVTMDTVTVKDCWVKGSAFGAIYVGGDANSTQPVLASLEFKDSSVSGGKAVIGGGIAAIGNLTISGTSRIAGNAATHATYPFGGLYMNTIAGGAVTCTGTPVICGNGDPASSATYATNCGLLDGSNTSSALPAGCGCAGTFGTTTAGTGVCPA